MFYFPTFHPVVLTSIDDLSLSIFILVVMK